MELKARFEQQRGLWMVLEGIVPWRREKLDPLQVGMLQACSIPGLLPVSVEELDGEVRLRYRLSACRMLSQTLRAERWTMIDAMAALCKLAEAAEQCQDHMLDFRRLMLDDDHIFVGDGWHDLRFAYLPLDAGEADLNMSAGLERLIVRWLMRTEDPDGKAMQQMLELAASREFVPSALRGYARQYLCERAEQTAGRMSGRQQSSAAIGQHASVAVSPAFSPGIHAEVPPLLEPQFERPSSAVSMLSPERGGEAPAIQANKNLDAQSWWFNEASDNPDKLPVAGAKGESELSNVDDPIIPGGMTVMRWRLWLGLLSSAAAGIGWKMLYGEAPGTKSAILSLGVTAACVGLCLYLWNGFAGKMPLRSRHSEAAPQQTPSRPPAAQQTRMPERSAYPAVPETDESMPPSVGRSSGRFIGYGSDVLRGATKEDGNEEEEARHTHTEWLPAKRDATELLSSAAAAARQPACFLEWESGERPCRIALQTESVIIGRARDIAQHVDESSGISRAHLEMLRLEGGWAAKDLGSRNGSWLNGAPMAPYEPYPLASGDCLQMAGSIYRFHAAGA
ncbi:DUF6382 domain-containing protein [Cohnella sp. 56]|uniref:DUF6382 domain-containing protein n=1 Tax=Cohnella sp. 56 TaxID=3113722 RepID=UPI0030EAF08F